MINQIEPCISNLEIKAIKEYLESGGWLTEFKKTEEFEQRIAERIGSKYCVVVTSGTAALYLTLLACGIQKGDKILVPNYTMIATINAIKWAGAEPILVDINSQDLCMDLGKARGASECKALMYVPINGRSDDMETVVSFCKVNNLILIEDACQAFGSLFKGKALGTFGKAGVFSFTPHKIITTGQGGCIVTDDEEIYKKVKKLKDFGRIAPGIDKHDTLGFNFKFTDLQAVIGLVQLEAFTHNMMKKKLIYTWYRERLIDVVEFLPLHLEETLPWFVDIILPNNNIRDRLVAFLKAKGIGSRPFYPPINHQKIYSVYKKGDFPVSEDLALRGLWLPSYVHLAMTQVDYICEAIDEYFA